MDWYYWLRELFTGKRRPKPRRASGGAGKSKRIYPTYRVIHRDLGLKGILLRLALAGGMLVILIFAYLSIGLPDINSLNKFTKAPSILIKSEDGQIVGSYGDIYGDYVPYEELPVSLIDAVLATEDRNFYHHFGVDPFGLLRATIANIRARHVVQGGSTITQQVAKNVFLTPQRSFSRKIREMMLALKLEQRYSKHDILSIYLNRVYLGAGNYGVDAASRRYFGKSARDMTLAESAIMAGLLKAPSRFAPTSNPERAKARAEQVLANMEDAYYLSKAQADRARQELATTMGARQRTAQSAMYFADWVVDQLPEYIGNIQDDLVVITTLRPDWQLLGEKAITQVMEREGPEHDAKQAALLSMTPDGAVRAMIGGRSYAASQFNRAAQSLRQPGSSFKLFVYLAGLEAGMTPDTIFEDEPVSIQVPGGAWQPKNYTGRYLGPVTIKTAVTESINTVAVQVAQEVGVDRVVTMAHRLGINSQLDEVPSIALGSTEVSLVELTTAYAHLAADGALVTPYGILEIATARGEPLYKREGSRSGGVLRSSIVGDMNEMLQSVVTSGTGRGAQIGRAVAGKTGTTSDYRDAWFIGFTSDIVTGVWVGNDNNTPMKKVTGGTIPAMIWHDFMLPASSTSKPRSLPSGGGWLQLPWQNDAPAYPVQSSDQQRKERKVPPSNSGKVKLGPSFWDKLFDDTFSNGEPERARRRVHP